MPGKLYNGTSDVPNDPQLARAYCEGRKAAVDAWPSAPTNPHSIASPVRTAWIAGVASFAGTSTGTSVMARDCCDILGTIAED